MTEISNNYTQQIVNSYNQKIDAADDAVQAQKAKMEELLKDPVVKKYVETGHMPFPLFNMGSFHKIMQYRSLQAGLPGLEAQAKAQIDGLKQEMANALKIAQQGSEIIKSMNAAGQAVTAANLKDMDIESAMMLVQMNRANQLENQLKDQISEIQSRNKQIAEINSLLASVRNARPSGEKDPEGKISAEVMDAIKKAGVDLPSGASFKDGLYTMKQSDFDKLVENLKGKIDSLNSTQQMDMIRLQSLTNKRNEAFEIMTNFISKMAKTRDSIVGNMR